MKLKHLLLSTVISLAGLSMASTAQASADPLLGEIMPVGFNFCPRGWAETNGQLLPINQNQALFSLLGTTYGGDGRTTFALPDLRSRSPMHLGTGPGLSARTQGQKLGTENETLNVNQIPGHAHPANLRGVNEPANTNNVFGSAFSTSPSHSVYHAGTSPESGNLQNDVWLDAKSIHVQNTGGGLSHNNVQPTLVLRYCIAVQGVFPSRN